MECGPSLRGLKRQKLKSCEISYVRWVNITPTNIHNNTATFTIQWNNLTLFKSIQHTQSPLSGCSTLPIKQMFNAR